MHCLFPINDTSNQHLISLFQAYWNISFAFFTNQKQVSLKNKNKKKNKKKNKEKRKRDWKREMDVCQVRKVNACDYQTIVFEKKSL